MQGAGCRVQGSGVRSGPRQGALSAPGLHPTVTRTFDRPLLLITSSYIAHCMRACSAKGECSVQLQAYTPPLSSKLGTCKPVKARSWPWLFRIWPWLFPEGAGFRGRANMAHRRQSRPDYGLGFQTFKGAASSLGSGGVGCRCGWRPGVAWNVPLHFAPSISQTQIVEPKPQSQGPQADRARRISEPLSPNPQPYTLKQGRM